VAVGSLTKPEELLSYKFLNPMDGNCYIDTTLLGNLHGTNTCPMNIGNYPNYSSEVQFIGNLGGVAGDSSWIEAGEPPIVSFHCPNDPYHPYDFGAVIIATTGEFFVNMSGSNNIHRVANALGNNDVFMDAGFADAISSIANERNDGHYGLFPFPRPTIEFAPWQWWDPSHANHTNASITNPDMSPAKAQAYMDTIVWYMAPRMAISHGLINPAGIADINVESSFSVFPNPCNDIIEIQSSAKEYEVFLVNMHGEVVLKDRNIKSIKVSGFTPGSYILQFKAASHIEHQRVILY